MKVHLVLFLLLILVSFTSNVNTLSTNSKSNSSIPQLTQQKRPDNETIYRVSKQLCWGCIAESLEFVQAQLGESSQVGTPTDVGLPAGAIREVVGWSKESRLQARTFFPRRWFQAWREHLLG
ncbi:hypothetical protein JHK86_046665 [Glycine max]|nr:hypothetical protein JHK86_046665 [Glycine max]